MKLKFWQKGAIIGLILGIIANGLLAYFTQIGRISEFTTALLFNLPVLPFYLIALWLTLIVMFATSGFIGDIQVVWDIITYTFGIMSWVVAFAVYAIIIERFFEVVKNRRRGKKK